MEELRLKRYKSIWKLQFIALLFLAAIVSFSTSASATEKLPYEYTFTEDAASTFNGIKAMNKMVITFEKNISISDKNKIYLIQEGKTEKLPLIKDVDVTNNNNKLTITFKNLQFLNYTNLAEMNYKLVVEAGTLYSDQTINYEYPFKIYEILPGFQSTFVNNTSTTINNNIFKNNAPRDVMIHIPKMYITEIETIHRYRGVEDTSNHALTNIDVLADEETARLKVSVNNIGEYGRDLLYRDDVEGFTMGQAGLTALVCPDQDTANCIGTADDFQLTAFDKNGKLVSNRNFKLKVINEKSDFTVNDYINKVDKAFGTTVSLYDLMSDTKLLEAIVTQIPVTELDKLGVTYALSNTASVSNIEELEMALRNNKITTIKLLNDIPEDITVNRDVTIEGNNQTELGNVTLGNGVQDITVRLKDVSPTNLTVDVGANGTAILTDVDVTNNTSFISGGLASVYLINFTSDVINVKNTTPIRIVTSQQIDNITVSSNIEVILEGAYGNVNVTGNANITMKKNTVIERINIEDGKKITLTIPKRVKEPIKTGNGEWTLNVIEPAEGEIIEHEITWIGETTDVILEAGRIIPFGVNYIVPDGVEWTVTNLADFGATANLKFDGSDLTINEVDSTKQPTSLILEGILDGTDDIYKMVIPITTGQ